MSNELLTGSDIKYDLRALVGESSLKPQIQRAIDAERVKSEKFTRGSAIQDDLRSQVFASPLKPKIQNAIDTEHAQTLEELNTREPVEGTTLGEIRKGYRRWMASSPMHAGLAHGVPLALLGYFGLPALLKRIFGKGNIHTGRSRIVGGVLGGLAGAIPGSLMYNDRQTDPERDWSPSEALLEPSADLISKEGSIGSIFGMESSATRGVIGYTAPPAHTLRGPVTQDFMDRPSVGISTALATIEMDKNLSPGQQLQAKATVQLAAQQANQTRKGGLISTNNLINSVIGGGVGYVAGRAGGAVLGTFFGLSPRIQRRLAQAGMVAGIARATGIWQ